MNKKITKPTKVHKPKVQDITNQTEIIFPDENAKPKFPAHWILIGILVVIIAGLLKFNYSNTKQKAQQSIKDKSLPKIVLQTNIPFVKDLGIAYQFTGSKPEIIETAHVYSIKGDLIATESANTISKTFNFKSEPITGNHLGFANFLYRSEDKDSNLTVYNFPTRLQYDDYSQTDTKKTRLSADQLKDKATEFLKDKITLKDDFALKQVGIETYSLNSKIQEVEFQTDPTKVDFYDFIFTYSKDDLTTSPTFSLRDPIKVRINPFGEVKRVLITFPPEIEKDLGSVNLTDLPEAVRAVINGQGTIAQINDPLKSIDTVDLKKGQLIADLKTIEVVYIFDEVTKTIQPYYKLSGGMLFNNQILQQVEINVIITALHKDLFK